MAKITGSEISFNLEVPDSEVVQKCQDIWDNPEKYSEYKNGSDSAYYDFLKHLWVERDGAEEVRLSDLVD